MKKSLVRMFLISTLLLFIIFIYGCIEERSKEITTDGSGNAEEIINITQESKLTITGYNSKGEGCSGNLNLAIIVNYKDIIKENFVAIDKGEIPAEKKTFKVKSGYVVKVKLTSGCPNSKYTLNYTLDSDQ